VVALFRGFQSIFYIGMLLFLTVYLFSILGIILFRDNDPLNFSNLHVAMFTLMRCATQEDWTDVMYTNMFGCEAYPYDDGNELCTDSQGHFWTSAMFFIFYVVVAALIMLTLVVGVITTSMEEAMVEMKETLRVNKLISETKELYGITDMQMADYRHAFSLIDLDDGGALSINELNVIVAMFNGSNPSKCETHETLLKRWDLNGDGEVDFSEFLVVLVENLHLSKSSGPEHTLVSGLKRMASMSRMASSALASSALLELGVPVAPVSEKYEENNDTEEKGEAEVDPQGSTEASRGRADADNIAPTPMGAPGIGAVTVKPEPLSPPSWTISKVVPIV